MQFHSVNNENPPVTFREAIFHGIAPDGGLYVPEAVPKLPLEFLRQLKEQSLHEVGLQVASLFVDEIPASDLHSIIAKALNFSIPLVKLEEHIFLLELFHGPTLAFKDIGARFLAEALSFFLASQKKEVTILVATSGDTGSAVAHGFYGVPHIKVYVLYPSGKISRLQEQQMTTLGGNIHAIEVEGTFDDCQRLLKQSLVDRDILAAHTLTTANSINLGRLLPQIFYYVWGIAQWQRDFESERAMPSFVVPSGNFGNLTAAFYAKWMGAPIRRLIAATNVNDIVPEYLRSGKFIPRRSVQTLSNAMDVGNPSNLVRIQALYHDDIQRLREDVTALSMSDDATVAEIQQTYERTGYILDPHTAVGVAVARTVLKQDDQGTPVIVTATAHPAKFPDIVERAINVKIPLPEPLEKALHGKKLSTRISPSYDEWKAFLLDSRRVD